MTIDIYSLPKSIQEAQDADSPTYFTGKPCKHGHIDARITANKTCCECNRQARRRSYPKTKRKDVAYMRAWRSKHPEQFRQHQQRFANDNPGYANQYSRIYNTSKWNAVPKWTSMREVQIIYDKARIFNRKWKSKLQVDHIIPLQSGTVCGLHCPDNLQLLDQTLNGQKSNTYQQDW